jgi:WD40 repeat-containing protein SMU1
MERKLEVESGDVIRLMIQFLKENGLHDTLRTLQEESQVTLNTVDDVDKFNQDILHGRWDAVLEVVSTLRLPAARLVQLFEQIVLELAELRELDTARALLRSTPAMQRLKRDSPDRYLRLEHILQRNYFDANEAYPGDTNKERQRQQLAAALKREVLVVPPSRLMSLLSQALKWQEHVGALPRGSQYDLFRGAAPLAAMEDEKFPTRNHKVIKFGKRSHPESAVFTPDGQYLVSGSMDGFIEVWDFDSGKLCKDLKYQAEDDFMMHDDAVTCLATSRDSQVIASGCVDGSVKVWRLRTGSCLRRYIDMMYAQCTY